MDVMKLAEERRRLLMIELDDLTRFIDMAEELLASAAPQEERAAAPQVPEPIDPGLDLQNALEMQEAPIAQAAAASSGQTGPEWPTESYGTPVDQILFQKIFKEECLRRKGVTLPEPAPQAKEFDEKIAAYG